MTALVVWGCGTPPAATCQHGSACQDSPGHDEDDSGAVGDGHEGTTTVESNGSTGTGSSQPPMPDSDDATTDPADPLFDVGTMPDVPAVAPDPNAVVFAHSSEVLFRLDPQTLEITEVGPFDGCGLVVDIAVDGNHDLYASTTASGAGIYRVDPDTAACSLLVAGTFGNNLSFVPPGVLDPEREILVAYADSQ